MIFKQFLFHVGNNHFPGHEVTIPFFLSVEYSYSNQGMFLRVENVEMSFKAIGSLVLSHNLAAEIDIAARQHHEKTYMKEDPDDLKGIFETLPEVDKDIEKTQRIKK